MEIMEAMEFPLVDAEGQFIDDGSLEVDCGIENVFNETDPKIQSGFADAEGSSSGLTTEPMSQGEDDKSQEGDPELTDLVDLALFDDCVAKKRKMNENVSKESISVVTEIAPISLSDPWKLKSCWMYLGLQHLYGAENSDQEIELSEYVVRGKVRRVRAEAACTYLDVFWPALAQEFAVEHNWLEAAAPTNFTPPGKLELTNGAAQRLLQSAPKKVCVASPVEESSTTITTSNLSPKRFTRTMSKTEAHYFSKTRSSSKKNRKRQRGSTPTKAKPVLALTAELVPSPTAVKCNMRASSNYQLVQVPDEPKELNGREVYVELSQWYCEQQLIDTTDPLSRLLVRGKIISVEHQKRVWMAEIFWGVFNEVSLMEVLNLKEIGARWGMPPGTRELSPEEWSDSESQQPQCFVWPEAKSVPSVVEATAANNSRNSRRRCTPGNFEVTKDDCAAARGKVLYTPFESVNDILHGPYHELDHKNVFVKGRVQRVSSHASTPVFLIAWEVLGATTNVPLQWFQQALVLEHVPDDAQLLSPQLFSEIKSGFPERPVTYRGVLARALLSTRQERRRLPRNGTCSVFARVCCQCAKRFVVYDKALLTAKDQDDGSFCCDGCSSS